MNPCDILAVYVARSGGGWGLVAVLRDGKEVRHGAVYPTFEVATRACIRASILGLAEFLGTA